MDRSVSQFRQIQKDRLLKHAGNRIDERDGSFESSTPTKGASLGRL